MVVPLLPTAAIKRIVGFGYAPHTFGGICRASHRVAMIFAGVSRAEEDILTRWNSSKGEWGEGYGEAVTLAEALERRPLLGVGGALTEAHARAVARAVAEVREAGWDW